MHRDRHLQVRRLPRGWRQGRGRLVPITPAISSSLLAMPSLSASSEPAVLAADAGAEVARTRRARDRKRTDASSSHQNGKVRTKRRPPPTLTIPKATRDFVWARDRGRCRVPGCRATRNIAAHHIDFRSQGGDHDPANIVLLCDGHHKLLHDGLLTITGRAPDALTFTRDGKRLVDTRRSVEVEADRTLREQAKLNDASTVARSGPRATRSGSSTRSRFETS